MSLARGEFSLIAVGNKAPFAEQYQGAISHSRCRSRRSRRSRRTKRPANN